jgi:hypothetical protein
MKIGGWKTRKIFEPYNIQNMADKEEALAKLQEKRQEAAEAQILHDSFTFSEKPCPETGSC